MLFLVIFLVPVFWGDFRSPCVFQGNFCPRLVAAHVLGEKTLMLLPLPACLQDNVFVTIVVSVQFQVCLCMHESWWFGVCVHA